MIDRTQMVPLLVEVCPSFTKSWEEFLNEWANEPEIPYYGALADFARHMCSLLSAGDEQTLKRIFAVIERLHIEGDHYVKEAVSVGLLEDMQNCNLHLENTDPEQFVRFLLPESARWRQKIEDFWLKGKLLSED